MIPPQPPQGDLKLQGLTRQEIKRIEKSMKRPQFMGLLNQYMIQISDPKNKTEYDQYLKQMEKQGQLPKHMKLVKLKPEFCFRTNIVSDRNKKHQMKFFVNMCSSEYIDKPTCQLAKSQSGGGGYNWRIPNSLGKIRYDQDKHKNPCQVIDCAFHPDTFIFANQNQAFQRMIISIALEGAQKQLGQRKQTLSRDYIILKKLICKGQNGQPALLPIRYIEGKAYNKGEGPAQQQRNTQGKQLKIQKQLNNQKQKYLAQKNKNKQNQAQPQQQKQQDLQQTKKPLVQDLQKGIQTPKFTSIYTYLTDYSQFIEGMASTKKRSLPNSFTVQFKVPRMENISEANNLEINDKKIVLSVQDKYFIDISFEDMKVKNYPLKYSEAKAKFDKKKKTLRIQIPVDVASIHQEELAENIENTQKKQEEQKVIQNQVWKSKILEIPDQENTYKFLAKEQVQQNKQKNNKKLIQQIDQDDYVQEVKQKQKQTNEFEDIEQNEKRQQRTIKQFHISDYYETKEIKNFEKYEAAENLNYVFKQNHNSVIIMVYMRNYKDQQIKVGFREQKAEFVLLWLSNTFSALHLCLNSQFIFKVKKVQVMKLVGYYAVIIEKANKGQTWGEACLQNRLKGQQKTLGYFQQLIQRIRQQSEEKNAQKQKQQEQKAIQIKQKQENIQINQKQQKLTENNQKITEKKDKVVENLIDDKINEQTELRMNGNVNSNPLFHKLPIQFLKFQAPFIDTLN